MDQFLMTTEDAVNYLKSCCKDNNGMIPKTFGGFYCGITNNVERREGEHSADYLGYVKAKSVEVAKRLGLKRVPAIIVDYDDVKVWTLRKEIKVSQNLGTFLKASASSLKLLSRRLLLFLHGGLHLRLLFP